VGIKAIHQAQSHIDASCKAKSPSLSFTEVCSLSSADGRELVSVLLGPRRKVHLGLGSLQSTRQTELASDALNTVSRVDVLDEHNLVAGGGALARRDGG
jgi:hypothetical protein